MPIVIEKSNVDDAHQSVDHQKNSKIPIEEHTEVPLKRSQREIRLALNDYIVYLIELGSNRTSK